MSCKVVFSQEMVEAVSRLRASGMDVVSISEKLGISHTTFQKFRRTSGLKLSPIKRTNNRLIGNDR